MKIVGCFRIALNLLFVILHCTRTQGELTCKKINSCSCSYDDEHIIDLSPLVGNPKWENQYDPQDINMYSYNPCNSFVEGTCQDVALCQYTGVEYYALGTQESVKFTIEQQTGVLSLQYKSNDSIGVTRTSQVITECLKDGQPDSFSALGETSPGSGYYLFTLSSQYCCPAARPRRPTSSPLLSYGSQIAIGFAGAVVVYLCSGILVQKYVRHQTGRDVIPNYSFWSALPGLVKDGVVYTFTCRQHNNPYESV